jgi:hypothetical protein
MGTAQGNWDALKRIKLFGKRSAAHMLVRTSKTDHQCRIILAITNPQVTKFTSTMMNFMKKEIKASSTVSIGKSGLSLSVLPIL